MNDEAVEAGVSPIGAAREEFLAKLLNELVERLEKGEAVDIEDVTRRHPDLASDLRELWAAAQIAHDIGRTSSHGLTDDFAGDERSPKLPDDGPIKSRVVG